MRVVVALLVLAACDVGRVPPKNGFDGGVADGGIGPDADCEASRSGGSGHHNAGQDCISGGCHDGTGGQGVPTFTVAGTLYQADLVTPLANATITLDIGGALTKLTTSASGDSGMPGTGNFFTSDPIEFPLTTNASLCPSRVPMTNAVTMGSCNTAGCHAAASGNGRIHLP